MIEPQPIIPAEDRPPREWQKARHEGVDLALADLALADLAPAPGTHIYISAEGVNHHTLVLLRASIRAMERAGYKIKLL